jgi:hypothetical protein
MIGIVVIAFAVATPMAWAAQDKKAAQRAEVEAGKACSAQCTEKHGNGTKKGEVFDRAAYENCMNVCMKERQTDTIKTPKK